MARLLRCRKTATHFANRLLRMSASLAVVGDIIISEGEMYVVFSLK